MKPQILERLEEMAGERGMFLDIRFGVRPARTPAPAAEEKPSLLPPPEEEAPDREEAPPSGDRKVPLRDRPAVPPPPIPEVRERPLEVGLTIRERAARRLQNWPKGESGKERS